MLRIGLVEHTLDARLIVVNRRRGAARCHCINVTSNGIRLFAIGAVLAKHTVNGSAVNRRRGRRRGLVLA